MEWISVEDSTPKHMITCIVYTNKGGMLFGFRSNGKWFYDKYKGDAITHWMLAPPPPKTKER